MYRAKIKEGAQFDLEHSGERYKVNDSEVAFDCQPIQGNNFHLTVDNKSFRAELVKMDKSKSQFVFLINDIEVALDLEDDYDLLLDRLGIEKGAGAKAKNSEAPMPGLVLQVLVKEGDLVEKDEALLVLEAMKMENVIKAPDQVTISSVDVQVGEKVDKGQTLISFAQ